MCCGSRPGSRCAGSPAASEHLEGPPLTAAWSLGSCRQLLGGGRCGSRWVSSVTLSPQDPTRGAPSLASWRTPVAHRTCAASGPGAKAGISGPQGAEGTPRPAFTQCKHFRAPGTQGGHFLSTQSREDGACRCREGGASGHLLPKTQHPEKPSTPAPCLLPTCGSCL